MTAKPIDSDGGTMPFVSDAERTAALYTALDDRFQSKADYDRFSTLVLREVRNAAGFSSTVSADALVFELWESKKLRLTGLEVKASRSDWLRELKKPQKGEAFSVYCDAWFVVAFPGMVKVEELPTGWGLMEVNAKGRLQIIIESVRPTPPPIPRTMLAAILRNVTRKTYGPLLAAVRKAEGVAWERRIASEVEARVSRVEQDYRRLKQLVEDFETTSGLQIGRYDGVPLGPLVATARRINEMTQLAHALVRHAESMCIKTDALVQLAATLDTIHEVPEHFAPED